MLFVKSFTPEDFQTFWSLHQKARNSRHFRLRILICLHFYSQNWNDIPIYISIFSQYTLSCASLSEILQKIPNEILSEWKWFYTSAASHAGENITYVVRAL